ncbi:TPA: phage holin [Streptococcus pyogenes]|nr:phage holin [Streptococcus pyogenes]
MRVLLSLLKLGFTATQSKKKVTLMAILGAIFLLAQQLGIKLPSNIADIANTAVTLLVLLGVVTDPTTKGLSDSEQALTYHEPKK